MSQVNSSASNAPQGTDPQRRLHYRVSVVPTSSLQVKIWKIPQANGLAQRPLPSQELKVAVRQICAGGLSVSVLSKDGQLPSISTIDRLRIEMRCGSELVLVEGRFREPHATEDSTIHTGIFILPRQVDKAAQFTRLPAIIGIVQQEELRYLRQAASAAAA